MSTAVTDLNDFLGIAAGFRRLTADVAWIQTLEYYGTPELNQSEEEEENGGGQYPFLKAYCDRVVRIDPYFTYVYYYGGGALGWNLNRLDEAEALLREGILANPREYRLQQYLAAMAYQQNHDVSKLVQFLEGFITDRDCPNLLRSVLANIFKKQKQYTKALRIWVMIYDTGDAGYRQRAEREIGDLANLARIGHKAP